MKIFRRTIAVCLMAATCLSNFGSLPAAAGSVTDNISVESDIDRTAKETEKEIEADKESGRESQSDKETYKETGGELQAGKETKSSGQTDSHAVSEKSPENNGDSEISSEDYQNTENKEESAENPEGENSGKESAENPEEENSGKESGENSEGENSGKESESLAEEFPAITDQSLVKGVDFSSKRLIVTADESVIIDSENILGSYDDIYLLQYDSKSEAARAYAYYSQKADTADADIGFTTADIADADIGFMTAGTADAGIGFTTAGTADAGIGFLTADTADAGIRFLTADSDDSGNDSKAENGQNGNDSENITDITDPQAMSEELNPITELKDASVEDDQVKGKHVIALIDTGVSDGDNIKARLSMLGEDAGDDNGHGDKMAAFIRSVDPDAQILSIKALDSNGKGTVSSVYAAIRYAIEQDVKVINLSMSAYSLADNDCIREAVKEAVKNGIMVTGAAGNQGSNVKYYIPGNIDEAIIAGACYSDGTAREISNYGSTVDCLVNAQTTSEAAAKLAAWLAANSYSESWQSDLEEEESKENGLFFAASAEINDEEATEAEFNDGETAEAESENQDENSDQGCEDGSFSVSASTMYVTAKDRKTIDLSYSGSSSETNNHHLSRFTVTYGTSGNTEYTGVCGHVNMPNKFVYDDGDNKDEAKASMANTEFDLVERAKVTGYTSADTIEYKYARIIYNLYYNSDSRNAIIDKFLPEYDYETVSESNRYVLYFIQVAASYVLGQYGKNSDIEDIMNDAYGYDIGGWGKKIWNWIDKNGKDIPYDYTIYIVYGHANGDNGVGKNETQPVFAWNAKTVPGVDLEKKAIFKDGTTASYSVKGAKYALYSDSKKNNEICTVTLGEDGSIAAVTIDDTTVKTSAGLPAGLFTLNKTFYACETKVPTTSLPEGYSWVLDDELKKCSWTGDLLTLEFEDVVDTPYAKIHKNASVNVTGTDFSGAKYAIYSDAACANKITELSLDSQGDSANISTELLKVNTFYVKETKVPDKAPDGYIWVLDTQVHKETWDRKADATFSVSDELKPVYAKIHKSASGGITGANPAGAKYAIYSDAACKNKITEVTIGSNGDSESISSVLLNVNTFYVKETKVPDKAPDDYEWVLDTAVHKETWSRVSDATFSLTDVVKKQTRTVSLKKISSLSELTSGNSLYSLSGAVYGIYKDKDCSTLAEKITTDQSGAASSSGKYEIGTTLYIKEETPSQGYKLDEKIYSLTVSADDSKNSVTSSEIPMTDSFALYKQSSYKDLETRPEAFAGAVFKATYYDNYSLTSDSQTRTWYFETKSSDGRCGFTYDKSYLAKDYESSQLFTDENGAYALPLGTVTIQEIKAPQGYTVNEALLKWVYKKDDSKGNYDEQSLEELEYSSNSSAKGSLSSLTGSSNGSSDDSVTSSGDFYALPETPIFGGIIIQKIDAEKTGPDADQTLEGAQITIYNASGESKHCICTDDKGEEQTRLVADGEAMCVLTTDADGIAGTASAHTLEYGTYYAVETREPMGYKLNKDWKLTFTITEDGIYNDTTKEDEDILRDTPVKIHTTASSKGIDEAYIYGLQDDGSCAYNDIRIEDKVECSDLTDGTYLIEGILMDKATGEKLTTSAGKTFTSYSIISTDGSGSCRQNMEFELTGQDLQALEDKDGKCSLLGGGLVVFERLYNIPSGGEENAAIEPEAYAVNARLAAKHENLSDENQDIRFPEGRTHATDGASGKSADKEETNAEKDTLSADDEHDGSEDGYHEILSSKSMTVNDRITYSNLHGATEYTVSGILYVNDGTPGGSPALDDDGNQITVTKTFTTDGNKEDKISGYVDVTFGPFSGKNLAGQTVVAFETMTTLGIEVFVHADINDAPQTLHVPKIGTSAGVEGFEDMHESDGEDSSAKLTDQVSYENLMPGTDYVLCGQLVYRYSYPEEGIKAGENIVTAQTSFRTEGDAPEGSSYTGLSGSTELIFDSVDWSALKGKSVVVYETLYRKGEEPSEGSGRSIAEHKDLTDDGQSISIPSVGTKASDGLNGSNEGQASSAASIIDTVTVENLHLGQTYTISGILMDKDSGNEFVTSDGNKVTAEREFTSDDVDNLVISEDGKMFSGTVELEFKLDSSELADKTLVVFEDLYHKGVHVGAHADLDDADQSMHIIDIGTTAVDQTTGGHEGQASEKQTIVDTVDLKNLSIDETYTIKGVLMNKDTGKELTIDGKTITASKTFTYEDVKKSKNTLLSDDKTRFDAMVELEFTFDSSKLAGKSLVVFENLYNADLVKIASHENIEDDDQTVDIIDLKTKAADSKTLTHEGQTSEEETIVDSVKVTNLLIGKEYTIEGTLMNKSTKKALKVNGKEVTAEKTFTYEDIKEEKTTSVYKDGKHFDALVKLSFTFDSSKLAGKTLVAFEKLYKEKVCLASHEDLTDQDQSVNMISIKTNAVNAATGSKKITADSSVEIEDTVTYEGLKPDTVYILKGTVMNKATGNALKIDGKKVTAQLKFRTPKSSQDTVSGKQKLTIKLNASSLEGKSLVVFEELLDRNKNTVAVHKDINDKDQTVKVIEGKKTNKADKKKTNTDSKKTSTETTQNQTNASSAPVKTGDSMNPLLWLTLFLLAGASIAVLIYYRRKSSRKEK